MKPSDLPWTEQYEALRRQVLAGREPSRIEPLGVGLVCRRGLAGWMDAWRRATQSPVTVRPEPPRCPVTPDWHHELTVVLAQMTAPHLSRALP